jgi:phosphatidate cytidylyltransferase
VITARRVGTGVVVGAAMVGLVLIDWFGRTKWGTSLAVIALSCGALAELYGMFEGAGVPCHRRWGVFCSAALMTMRVGHDYLGLTNSEAHAAFLAGLSMAALAPLMGRVVRAKGPIEAEPEQLRKIGATVFGLVYVTLCASFLLEIRLLSDPVSGGTRLGLKLLFLLIAVVKLGDTAAYFVGRMIGRRPLSPVSPKKTIEGSIASLAASVAVALVLGEAMFLGDPRVDWRVLIGFGVVADLAGQGGDLVESYLKRVLGAKDSAPTFGEMGGLLDVADALLLAAPAAYLWVELLVARGG